jgi:coenzyme F420-0:L-glutamate ligase / coenzyme F420-1:gamma-L-glutamate ligase
MIRHEMNHSKKCNNLEIIPIFVSNDIKKEDDISEIIIESSYLQNISLMDNDIVIIAQKIISKAEGEIVDLDNITPSDNAIKIALTNKKDPRLVELIISQSKSLLKFERGIIIAETKHGFICTNAGIDGSNVDIESNHVLLLPENPDLSANSIRLKIKAKTNKDVAIIISDTFGRPFRNGQVNMAIGVSGMDPIKNYIGKKDMYGNILRVTKIAVADEIASAAEIVMGKSNRVPVVILRGYKFRRTSGSISKILRSKENDLFRSDETILQKSCL